MNRPFSNEHYKSIEQQVRNAQDDVRRHPGSSVAVVCTGGAIEKGGWIEFNGGYDAPAVEVHREDSEGISSTRLTLDSVAGITVTMGSETPAFFEERVPPSRRDMTIVAVLIEAWGQVEGRYDSVTYGDLRQALSEIRTGSSDPVHPEASDAMPLNRVSPVMMPDAMELVRVLGSRRLSAKHVERYEAMQLLHLLHDIVDEDEPRSAKIDEAVRNEIAKIGVEPTTRVGEIEAKRREELMVQALVATRIRELKRRYHPFIIRGELRLMAEKLY